MNAAACGGNDEIRMTNDERMPEAGMTKKSPTTDHPLRASSFGFLSSFVIRHSSFSLLLLLTATASSAEPTRQQIEFFESKIRPILTENCYQCHSLEKGKSKGGLTLDTRDGWMHGGEDGAVIIPGDPAKSMLIQAVSYTDKDLQMPPKDRKLADQDIAALTEWVNMGAPDPRLKAAAGAKLTGLTDQARAHWAFQPVKKPAIPEVKNKAWCATVVDKFILAKLEANHMIPSPQANRETLIRRACYDLTGLPPSPQEVQAFVADPDPNAYVKLVDRLLASPHYGERWGRHWLDTARYSDTKGDMGNAQRELDYRYPYAWTYRDYVIDSFNRDKPYNQFIIEQIAADRLPETQQDKTRLAALGFLTVGQRFQNVNDVINDRIDTVSKGFMGITVSCARCHDHKFDPIPTTDYYALHGVFASTVEPLDKPIIRQPDPAQFADFQQKLEALETEDRKKYYDAMEKWLAEFHAKPGAYLKALTQRRGKKNASAESVKAFQEQMKKDHLDQNFLQSFQNRFRRPDPVLGPLRFFADLDDSDFAERSKNVLANMNRQGTVNPLVLAAFKDVPPPSSLDEVIAIYDKLFTGMAPQTKSCIDACVSATAAGPVQGFDHATTELLEFPLTLLPAPEATTVKLHQIAGNLPRKFGDDIRFNFPQINELELTHSGAPARAMVVADAVKPQDSRVFIRGQAEVKGDVVPRRFLEVLSPDGKPQPFKDGSGRLELARDIASPSNPLTARVMVNRVWMYHFGEGFVRTPDNLGTQSETPSHPELLDYLATYFVENGWSVKKLHRLIMLSKVYQESSGTIPACEQADPQNRLLWRANIRRLDFESLRDTLLAVGGKLDPAVGGQPVNLTDEPYSYRRSVYGYIDRGHLPELMSLFDFSDPDMTNSKRSSTIVPQQALFLMNSPMSVAATRDIVARPEFRSASNDTQRILQLYRIIFQRAPRPLEIQLGLQFIAAEQAAQAQLDASAKPDQNMRRFAEQKARLEQKAKGGRQNAQRPIQNTGDPVERKPLTPWETYAQTLLFSNEASYVN